MIRETLLLNLLVFVLALPLDLIIPGVHWNIIPYVYQNQYPRWKNIPQISHLSLGQAHNQVYPTLGFYQFPWDHTQEHTFECPTGHGGIFPNGEDCSKYYECSVDGRVSFWHLSMAINVLISATRGVPVPWRNVFWFSIWCLWFAG